MKTPTTLDELFQFYREKVKTLYSYSQSGNQLPQETLFEINAAWDHLARRFDSENNQTEEYVVEKAYSHLRRSCLDIFKLALKNANDQYRDINKVDLSLVDNGDGVFKKELVSLLGSIRDKAEIARREEGRDFDRAYDTWWEMYIECRRLEKDFYYSHKIQWARKRLWWKFFMNILMGLVCGVISTLFVQRYINS
jgi:hypothetical protein